MGRNCLPRHWYSMCFIRFSLKVPVAHHFCFKNDACQSLQKPSFDFSLCISLSSFLEIDFEINISDKKSRRFDLSEVIFKCIKVL